MPDPAAPRADDGWTRVGAADALGPGAVVPVEVDGVELVVWRALHGPLCAVGRRCPHLDADLASDGVVAGDELVCGAHFWRIDRRGSVSKHNVRGRRDHKLDVPVGEVREVDGEVWVRWG